MGEKIGPQRGRIWRPKAKGPHHHFQILKLFQLVSVSKREIISKILLTAKGRTSLGGAFYLVKGKVFEIGGGISNLENDSWNHILIPLAICKRIWKYFSKWFAKTS
jgi:hypothetical protein